MLAASRFGEPRVASRRKRVTVGPRGNPITRGQNRRPEPSVFEIQVERPLHVIVAPASTERLDCLTTGSTLLLRTSDAVPRRDSGAAPRGEHGWTKRLDARRSSWQDPLAISIAVVGVARRPRPSISSLPTTRRRGADADEGDTAEGGGRPRVRPAGCGDDSAPIGRTSASPLQRGLGARRGRPAGDKGSLKHHRPVRCADRLVQANEP